MSKISLPEILIEEFMIPFGLDSAKVAEKTGIEESVLLDVLYYGKQIDQGIAEKLAAAFDNTPRFWLNIQEKFTKA